VITHPLHQPEAKNPACAVLLAPRGIHAATQPTTLHTQGGEPGSPPLPACRNQFNNPASPSRRCALVTHPASEARGTNQFYKGTL